MIEKDLVPKENMFEKALEIQQELQSLGIQPKKEKLKELIENLGAVSGSLDEIFQAENEIGERLVMAQEDFEGKILRRAELVT